jgi:CheY-like chemotaxis protein
MSSLPSDLLRIPQDSHRILVVDGEVLSRLVIADYLRECGYRVHEAASTAEAMEILATTDIAIDLVLCDVTMPAGSTDGFGLARWVRETLPEVKVILSSGAARSADIAGELCEAGPMMKKPFAPQHAVDRIKQLLATARRRSDSTKGRLAAGIS